MATAADGEVSANSNDGQKANESKKSDEWREVGFIEFGYLGQSFQMPLYQNAADPDSWMAGPWNDFWGMGATPQSAFEDLVSHTIQRDAEAAVKEQEEETSG